MIISGRVSGSFGSGTIVVPSISSFSPSSGQVGDAITITGTGFNGVTSVDFNGSGAFYVIQSDTQIIAIIPTGATSGPIHAVVNPSTKGTSSSLTIVANPFAFSLAQFTMPTGLTVTRTGGTLYPQTGASTVHAVTSAAIIDNWGPTWGPGVWTFPAMTNCLAKPFDFTATGGWSYANQTPTITANAAAAPDGTTTASKVTCVAGTHAIMHQDALGTAYPITAATVWVSDVPGDQPTPTTGALSARNDSGAASSLGTGSGWRREHAIFSIGANVAGYIYIHPVGATPNGNNPVVVDSTAHGSVYLWGACDTVETMGTFLPLIDGATTSATLSVDSGSLSSVLNAGDLHLEGSFLMDKVDNAAPATSIDDPTNLWLLEAQTPSGVVSLQWGGQTNIYGKINGANVVSGVTLVQNIGFQTQGSIVPAEFKWELWNKPSNGNFGMQFWINGTRDASTQVRHATGALANATPTAMSLGSKTDGTGILVRRESLLRRTTRDIDSCEGIVFGDSITANYSPMTGSYQYIYSLWQGRARPGIVSYAYPGERVDQQQARYDACAQKGQSYVKWGFLMAGVNDVIQAATAATVTTRIQAFVTDFNTNNPGVPLLLAPITPCKGDVGATEWTTIQAINANIEGTGGTPITGTNLIRMPLWTALDDGAGNLLAQYDSGDHLHPNDLGRSSIIGPAIASTLHSNGLL